MYTIIIMLGVSIPLLAIGFYAMYRENKEKREEQMQANNTEIIPDTPVPFAALHRDVQEIALATEQLIKKTVLLSLTLPA